MAKIRESNTTKQDKIDEPTLFSRPIKYKYRLINHFRLYKLQFMTDLGKQIVTFQSVEIKKVLQYETPLLFISFNKRSYLIPIFFRIAFGIASL